MELQDVKGITKIIKREVGKAIIGQADALNLMLVSLLCGGHVLLEGPPGTGKTFLAQSFTSSLNLQFGRIQFTPDMMPGDVLGTNLFNFQTNDFILTKGAIFTEILLADEINRTPPKTQAALLQAMNERVVTIDGKSYDLSNNFMVIATQNPIEQQGTYPLPEAQLDRFMFKLEIGYPTREEEQKIVSLHGHRSTMQTRSTSPVMPVIQGSHLEAMRNFVEEVFLDPELIAYIVDIIRGTREHVSIETGASPRAATMLAAGSRAYAVTQGRDFVVPDDIKTLAIPLLHHRIIMTPNADINGISNDFALAEILDQIVAPR